MADFAVSYGEWESQPVFNITAKCGHSFQEHQDGLTIEQYLGCFGEVEKCSECLQADRQAMLDEADYRLNPDTEALGWARIADAISFQTTLIGQPAEQEDEDLDSEETRMTISSVEAAIRQARAVISEWEEAGFGMDSWGEEQTRYAVIDPIISALGWKTCDPRECLPEYWRVRDDEASGRVDYALFSKQSLADIGNGLVAPDIIIVSKSLNVELDDTHLRQLPEYREAEPRMRTGFAVLTHGREWWIFENSRRSLHRAYILVGDPKVEARILSRYLARGKFE